MANLTIDTTNNLFIDVHTVSHSGTYNYILDTENKFVDKKVKISFYTPAASITAGSSSVTSTINSTSGTNATNIHGVLSTSTSRPSNSSEYYIALDLTGSGNSAIDTDGWITTNTTLPTASGSTTAFYTIQKASGTVTNNAAVTTTVTITTGNVVTTSTNNGIYIKSTGSSTASGSITASISTAGYIPTGTMATATISKTATTTATTYITGVTVPNTTFTVTAATNQQGTIKIAAYSTSSASNRDALQTVVTSGVWNTTAVTPGTSDLGPYYGKTTVAGDADLIASNIRHGVNIFGVAGTFSRTSTVSSGQTASTSAQILTGYSAWVDGAEVKGNMANNGALNQTITTQNGTIIVTAGYYSGGTVTASLPTTSVTQRAWSKNATTKVISTTYANWGVGYIATAGNVPAVTFSNTASNTSNYIDLSDALISSGGSYYLPEATNDGYIYITRGYIDNVKIDIGRFIPDFSDTAHAAASDKILKGFHAYDGAGGLLTGTIESIAATTYTPTTSNQTIAAGQYISGVQTIEGDANLVAAKIQDGVTIFGVAGTFSNTSTITGSKTAVTAASLRSGYAAFINGAQINGTMPDTTASTTFANTGLDTYFSTTNSGGNVTINTNYKVTTAGYISAGTVNSSTTARYNIKTTSLSATAGNVTLTSDTTGRSSTTPTLPFSIYSSSVTRNIKITTAATTALMGENRVYIKVEGTGAVAASTTGWLTSTASVSSTTATRYVSLDYYTGSYNTTEETGE